MSKPPCPAGLLPSSWGEATTQLWRDQDKETQAEYKSFFGTRTDLNAYSDIQLELLHSYRLYLLVGKKRKAASDTTDQLSDLTKKYDRLKEAKAAVDEQLSKLQERLEEAETRPTMTTAQADSIVAFIKGRATSVDATEELAEVKKKLALETKHHTAVWAVLKANCADDPKRFQDFKSRIDHELGRTKTAPPVSKTVEATKRISFPREQDDVHFQDGEKKRKGKILRVLPDRCYRVAPNDGDSGGPVNVPIAELFDSNGEPF